MVDLFNGITLIENNRDRDRLDTQQQLDNKVRNKLVLLYFGSRECPRCQEFAHALQDFSNRLMDEYYVDRAAQLVLVYVSQDQTERKEQQYLKTLHRKWLSLPFRDKYKSYIRARVSLEIEHTFSTGTLAAFCKRELLKKYNIKDTPSIVVLKPNGDLITRDGVAEISNKGVDCFKNWWEASEVIDRNFLLAQDFEDWTWKTLTDPLRQLKYRIKKMGDEKAQGTE